MVMLIILDHSKVKYMQRPKVRYTQSRAQHSAFVILQETRGHKKGSEFHSMHQEDLILFLVYIRPMCVALQMGKILVPCISCTILDASRFLSHESYRSQKGQHVNTL